MPPQIQSTNVIWVENKAGMYQVLKSPVGEVGLHMKNIGRKIQIGAIMQAGFRTGMLKLSIGVSQSTTPTGQEVRVGSSVPHALVHHEGTRPHRITGRNGGMLRFAKQGRIVYARSVMHPGTRPNKYLSDQLWVVRL
jgi:hypothetical protein